MKKNIFGFLLCVFIASLSFANTVEVSISEGKTHLEFRCQGLSSNQLMNIGTSTFSGISTDGTGIMFFNGINTERRVFNFYGRFPNGLNEKHEDFIKEVMKVLESKFNYRATVNLPKVKT